MTIRFQKLLAVHNGFISIFHRWVLNRLENEQKYKQRKHLFPLHFVNEYVQINRRTMDVGLKPQTSGWNGATCQKLFFASEKPHEQAISAIKCDAQVLNKHFVDFN